MTKHVFDLSETASRDLVARQLHTLADQIAAGAVDLSYDEWHGPTAVADSMNLVVGLKQSRRGAQLLIDLKWPTAEPVAA